MTGASGATVMRDGSERGGTGLGGRHDVRNGALVAVAVVDVGLALAALPIYPPGTLDLSASLIFGAAIASLAAVGSFLCIKVPRNRVGWLLIAAGTMLAIGLFGSAYALASITSWNGELPGTAQLAWATDVLFIPPIVIVAAGVPAVFPDGHLPSRRWRWLGVALVGGTLLATVRPAFEPGPVNETLTVENPFGLSILAPYLLTIDTIALLTAVPIFLGAFAALATRFRRGSPTERGQIKWLLTAASIAAVAFPMAFLFPGTILSDLSWIVGFGALVGFPVAIGIAVLRYRLYEIDRIISRTIGWAVTTGLVAGVFALAIVGTQAMLGPVVGESSLMVAASTLVAAAVSQPLYRWVQAVVDRRFNRTKVNAQHAVDRFAGLLRDEVNLAAIESATVRAVADVVRPERTALWVRERRLGPGSPNQASTPIPA
jgi:hypothetical protein